MGTLIDAFARNRGRIGMVGLFLWGALQMNPGYQAWKTNDNFNLFVNDALVGLMAYTRGAGRHKSDRYHRDRQEMLKP